MSKIKPFDAGGWFPIHNAVFDVIMPRLSPNGWKILCVAIRQTWGWVADTNGDPRHRREWDRVSYSQFLAKSGIKSRPTVGRALKECLNNGYLLRHQVGTERGQPAYVYALNRDFEVDWHTDPKNGPDEDDSATGLEIEPVTNNDSTGSKIKPVSDRNSTGLKTKLVTGVEIKPVTGLKIKPTKQKETNIKQRDDDGQSVDKMGILNQLTDFGVDEPIARRIVHNTHPENIRQWLVYAQQTSGLNNPVAFLVRRLLDAEPPPEDTKRAPDRHTLKTAMCPSCYLVRPIQYICSDCGQCFECCTCSLEDTT